MRIIKDYCDVCGKQNKKNAFKEIPLIDRRISLFVGDTVQKSKELCNECYEEIRLLFESNQICLAVKKL